MTAPFVYLTPLRELSFSALDRAVSARLDKAFMKKKKPASRPQPPATHPDLLALLAADLESREKIREGLAKLRNDIDWVQQQLVKITEQIQVKVSTLGRESL